METQEDGLRLLYAREKPFPLEAGRPQGSRGRREGEVGTGPEEARFWRLTEGMALAGGIFLRMAAGRGEARFPRFARYRYCRLRGETSLSCTKKTARREGGLLSCILFLVDVEGRIGREVRRGLYAVGLESVDDEAE